MQYAIITLNEGRSGQRYRITRISSANAMKIRLEELGIIEGTEITPTVIGCKKEISAYLARGAQIALRKETAAEILVTEAMP